MEGVKQRDLAFELEVYNAFQEEMAKEGAMATAVTELIMKRFEIYSPSTVWKIRKRVEARLAEEQEMGMLEAELGGKDGL